MKGSYDMKRSSGWYKTLAVMTALVLVVGACGSTAAPSTGGASAATSAAPSAAAASVAPAASASAAAVNACGDGAVALSIWGGYPELDPVFKKAGEAYKALHPNVDLTVFSTDLRGFEQKLTTALPSGTGGDIIVRTPNFLSRFIDQNLMAPLPDDLATFVKGGAYDPTFVTDSTVNGKLWSVPLFSGGTAIYYNKDMLAEANVTPPTTMEELFAAAKKLAKLDASGAVVRSGQSLRLSGQGSGVAEKFWILLLQYGRTLIKETSPGKWAADFNGPEGVKLFQTYVDFLQNKVDSLNIDHDAKAFETKATAMFLREPWVIAEIAATAPDLLGKYGTISPPVGDLGGGEYMFVPTASKNQACAWDFIKFMTAQEQQLSLATIAGWMPARVDLDLTEFLKANPTYEGFLKRPAGFKLTLTPPLPEFDEIETKLATNLVAAYADYANLAGQPDKIQALLNKWADETNQILKKNNHFGG